jgi:hypothetical protein
MWLLRSRFIKNDSGLPSTVWLSVAFFVMTAEPYSRPANRSRYTELRDSSISLRMAKSDTARRTHRL